jgi:hypothetical protein
VNLGWPQLIYLVLSLIGLYVAVSAHGTPKRGTENAWPAVAGLVISWALLWWGGFFQ